MAALPADEPLRWIESKNAQAFGNATKFHPLPKGEGGGEGEEVNTNPATESSLNVAPISFLPDWLYGST